MAVPQNKPKANPHISEISYLKKKPNPERAHDLLQDLTRSVSYLMRKFKLKVKTVAEFYPKDKNLLGLNVNRGQKIMVRLRSPYNDYEFLSWEAIVETMLHELTHNRFGPHDDKFYKQMEDFRSEHWISQVQGLQDNFLGTGRKLGGSGSRSRSNIQSKNYVGKGARLGITTAESGNGRRLTPREMAARAASKRNTNEQLKLCHDENVNIQEILDNHSQMESQIEVIVIDDDDDVDNGTRFAYNQKSTSGSPLDIIDLT
ncbi:similar to Saccharomyces cerevisiae YHR134W WSS1 Sumoylated protein that localizes to a single spot on the nuclear periphery of mother cells but not daughters [Maudiozyma barnettii]|uniref:Similar to Saccharomyces cerevisiae YHR134W WSS1 Sumoylated protein that localizes to a single spot on the nuclear periphery of mother cells but not daughters n=1 Tax=Maudiozyma barnettii TaxID=61262 RepID=A0A8H2ZJ54_9SACH|nr:metalloendopeptidase WSS1 [Kazachstania barnettii]CAB4255648.1 similar to Saccharomyces cerevisiae YHR134W WSS1 Sumoylated protein that localizes to a single spot on the nuclear periphery of mother cells but not daughters [Kazachstania barnettii]CAD1784209.1 similar to Saccharomyces cerevisiae YHR134W WSS1 Sumoylated protein that localizes to a single spot on the nuclear periphery of mother cells but not daughters [Kazachstania barnettii]